VYRSICTALGINVLSLSERQVPGNTAKSASNTQVDRSGPRASTSSTC
jgi:cytochrome c oxidase assembly protein subunit 11